MRRTGAGRIKMNDLEQAREKFRDDRFSAENGMVIDECADGYAKCSVTLCERHRNAAGNVMGGAVFTLADFAFAVAANWNRPLHVTRSSQITYLGAARGKRLTAEARIVKEGRSTCYCLVEVRDDLGTLVAVAAEDGRRVEPPVSGTSPRFRKAQGRRP